MTYVGVICGLDLKSLREEELLILRKMAQFWVSAYRRAFRLAFKGKNKKQIYKEIKTWPLLPTRLLSTAQLLAFWSAKGCKEAGIKKPKLEIGKQWLTLAEMGANNIKLDLQSKTIIIKYRRRFLNGPNKHIPNAYGFIQIQLKINRSKLEQLKKAIEEGKKFNFILKIHKWHRKGLVHIQWKETDPRELPERGVKVGIDLNPKVIAVVAINRDGNIVFAKEFSLNNIENLKHDAKVNLIGHTIKKIIEKLEQIFTKNGFTLYVGYLKNMQRYRSSYLHYFAYDIMKKIIISRCAKKKIPLRFVTEYFTSYGRPYKGMSRHIYAAWQIARRGSQLNQKIKRQKRATYKELWGAWKTIANYIRFKP